MWLGRFNTTNPRTGKDRQKNKQISADSPQETKVPTHHKKMHKNHKKTNSNSQEYDSTREGSLRTDSEAFSASNSAILSVLRT